MKRFLLLFLVINFLPIYANENSTNINATTKINWENKIIKITIENSLDNNIQSLQDAKLYAQKEIASIFSQIVQAAIEPIILNSKESIKDRFLQDVHLISKIDNLESNEFILTSYLSNNLKTLKSEFIIPLYENFSPIFISHDAPLQIEPVLGFIATYEWTGIIIMAKNELKIFGTDDYSTLNIALFPKILDDSGKIILSHNNIDPKIIKSWGYLTYVEKESDAPHERCGDYPLRIIANGVFGKNATDIVISKHDANKILTSQKNINLLKSGKIVVICQKEKLNSEKTIKIEK